MKKKIKPFTVDDFIIFLKAKIVIIIIGTFLLSSITIFFQVSYKDHWEVKISRTVDKKFLVQTIMLIKEKYALTAKELGLIEEKMSPIDMMKDLNNLSISTMISYLSNSNLDYDGLGLSTNENFLKKIQYELTASIEYAPNNDVLKKKLNTIFVDTNNLTKDILKMQYGLNRLDESISKQIYNFKIMKITRTQGFDYYKILKIIIMYFLVNIFFIFVIHIRKTIKLF